MWRSWKGHIIDISILFAPNQQILIEISIDFFYPCTVAAWRVNCVVKYSHYNWSGSPIARLVPSSKDGYYLLKGARDETKMFFFVFSQKKNICENVTITNLGVSRKKVFRMFCEIMYRVNSSWMFHFPENQMC